MVASRGGTGGGLEGYGRAVVVVRERVISNRLAMIDGGPEKD